MGDFLRNTTTAIIFAMVCVASVIGISYGISEVRERMDEQLIRDIESKTAVIEIEIALADQAQLINELIDVVSQLNHKLDDILGQEAIGQEVPQ